MTPEESSKEALAHVKTLIAAYDPGPDRPCDKCLDGWDCWCEDEAVREEQRAFEGRSALVASLRTIQGILERAT